METMILVSRIPSTRRLRVAFDDSVSQMSLRVRWFASFSEMGRLSMRSPIVPSKRAQEPLEKTKAEEPFSTGRKSMTDPVRVKTKSDMAVERLNAGDNKK